MSSYSYKNHVQEIQEEKKFKQDNLRVLDKYSLQSKCKCAHRDPNGSIALSPMKNKRSPITGAPLYVCTVCDKELDISNISEEDFAKALDIIDRVHDLSKMRLDIDNEKDRKNLKVFSKMQFKNNTILPDAYKTIRKGNKKKNKGNNSNGVISVGRV